MLEGQPGYAVYDFGIGERPNTGYPVFVQGKPTYFVSAVTPTSVIYSQINGVILTERIETFSLLAGTTAAIVVFIIFLIRWSSKLNDEVKRRRELNESNKELAVANEQLKVHDKMQKEFINIAAHELRTPIQPILSLSQILHSRKEDGGGEQEKEIVDPIVRNAKTLQHLTDDILDVTRIEGKSEQRMKTQTAILCSLLDILNIEINKQLLEYMKIYKYAVELESSILFRSHYYSYSGSRELWKTIHSRWDMELLSFLYSATDLSILEKRKRYLKNALNSVFELDNDLITTLVTAAIYDIAANGMVDIDIVDSVFQMPDNLTDEYMCLLYRAIIGRSYSLLQKHEEADESYSKALEINPNDADAWNNKGLALESLGRLGDAIKSYDKALDIDPNHTLAWYNKGNFLHDLGNHNEAIDCYSKALEINPNYVHAWNNKGLALESLEQYEKAINCYSKALEINPEYVPAWFNRGVSFSRLRKYEEAIESYDKALNIDPNDAKIWNNKGAVFYNYLGRYQNAIDCYSKALEINPNDADA